MSNVDVHIAMARASIDNRHEGITGIRGILVA